VTYERKILAFFLIDPNQPVEDSTQIDINHRIVIRDAVMSHFSNISELTRCILDYLFDEVEAKAARAVFRKRGEVIYQEREEVED